VKSHRLIIVALLLALAILCGLLLLDRDRPSVSAPPRQVKSLPGKAARPTPAPAPGQAMQVIPLATRIRGFMRSRIGAADRSATLHSSAHADVRLEVLGPTQRAPLHLHRAAHRLHVVLEGDLGYRQGQAPGEAGAQPSKAPPGTLLYTPPYCGLSLENRSATDKVAMVVFTSPSLRHDSRRYLRGDDPALNLCRGAEAGAALEPGPKGRIRGRLSTRTLRQPEILRAGAGPTYALVLQGAGQARAGAKAAPLLRHTMLFIPPGQQAQVAPARGAVLALLVFTSNPARDGILLTGKKRYSQSDEELIIRDFFGDQRDGVFLDVGASHHERDSTTYYLDRHLNWSGYAVDALGEYEAGYRKHRPRTRFFTYLITEKSSGRKKFFRSEKYPEVSSVSEEVARRQGAHFKGDDTVKELEVDSISLDDLLSGAKAKRLDFLSMDIEEHEPAALAGFDIKRHRPRLVCVEAHLTVQDVLYRYFLEAGYRRLDRYLARDPYNWYFTPVE